jgi:hypothetical protein
MTAFELVLVDAPAPPAACQVYCQCTPTGPERAVLVDIDEGHVNSVSCPGCGLSIDFSDGMDGVYANDVPMTMTTTVDKAPADSFSGYEIAAVWHELTPREGGES